MVIIYLGGGKFLCKQIEVHNFQCTDMCGMQLSMGSKNLVCGCQGGGQILSAHDFQICNPNGK